MNEKIKCIRTEYGKLMMAFMGIPKDLRRNAEILGQALPSPSKVITDVVDNEYNEETFPNTYGGSYYDSEREKLVVQTTSDELSDQLKSFLDNEVVDYMIVAYPIVKLLNDLKKITDNMIEYGVALASISQRKNRIEIHFLKVCDKEGFSKFCLLNSIDKGSYVILDDIDEPRFMFKSYGGEQISAYNTSTNTFIDSLTVGYNAVKGSEYGIVTAGHGYYSGASYKKGTTLVGYATANQIGKKLPFMRRNSRCYVYSSK